jgi:hypothetical protein
MYGPPASVSSKGEREASSMGLIPRAIFEIFELAEKEEIIDYSVYCSFVQIYNENLFDMLRFKEEK